ncbi:lantibiotic dehydratase [Actinosynnema sp. NPDC059797]
MWSLHRHTVVRSTGFPIALVHGLREPRLAQAVEEVVDAEDAVLALGRRDGLDARELDALREGLDRGSFRLDRARVDDPSWVAAVSAHRRARRGAQRIGAAGRERPSPVRALADDPRLREALAVSNPRIFADVLRNPDRAQVVNQLASFAQRVSTKNETLSFFGPISYGVVDPAAPSGVRVAWDGPHVLRARRAHAAAWVVSALADAVAFDPVVAPWLVLRPRNRGLSRWSGAADELPARLLAAVDGRSTLAVLARRLDAEPAEVIAAAAALCRLGLVTHPVDPPVTAPDPLGHLVTAAAGVPGGAVPAGKVAELARLRDRFCDDDAMAKADRHTRFLDAVHRIAPDAKPGDAVDGQFYTDRTPLREECAGSVDLEVGGEHATELLARCAPALDFLAVVAHRRRTAARRRLARALGARTVPLWKVVVAAHALVQPADTELDALVAEAVAAAGDATEVDLAAHPGPAALLTGGAAGGEAVATTVDVMVAAPDVAAWTAGAYRVVLGDVHDSVLLTDWALQFHPDAARVRMERDCAIADAFGPVPALTVLGGRRTGIPPLELPGPVVEVSGTSGRAGSWAVDLDDVTVRSDGVDARLWCDSLGGEVALHNGELDTLVQTAFGPLRLRAPRLRTGPHTPRLTWGAAVVQRRRWEVDTAEVASIGAADDLRVLLAATRLRRRHGLPAAVFAHLPGVRKPMYADLAGPALLRAVARAATRVDQRSTTVVSEMLPAADELWLAGPRGAHTAELRCLFTRRPGSEVAR